MNKENEKELTRNEYTDYIYEKICLEEPLNVQTFEDVINGINQAVKIENTPVFLEGLSARLTQLGTACNSGDTEIMLDEVKRRYKSILKKICPRTVLEWIRGTTPGITNRQNNYELCYALEMDYKQTAVFFQKNYLTLPFIVKSKTDAVFMYCLYHKKPYSSVAELLEKSKDFVSSGNESVLTSEIAYFIFNTDNDDEFLRYLSEHCYDNEQQFQNARRIIKDEIKILKESISYESINSDRLNSMTIDKLLGYRYQSREKCENTVKLPKLFTRSLPNDVTLGRIINGNSVSYEVLRKTLILLRFYNYYSMAENNDIKQNHEPSKYEINSRLMDFFDELNQTLISCGFAQLYMRHPFDCLILFCANSYDPIYTLHTLNEQN